MDIIIFLYLFFVTRINQIYMAGHYFMLYYFYTLPGDHKSTQIEQGTNGDSFLPVEPGTSDICLNQQEFWGILLRYKYFVIGRS
jgi:hypothetical protein